MAKQFRYCLMIFKRSELGSRNINYEYIHFKKENEQEAYDYAEQYSKEHDGFVVRLRNRIWCKELNKAMWGTIISFYNGRLFDNSLICKAKG